MDTKNKKTILIVVIAIVLLCVCCVVSVGIGYFGYVNYIAPPTVSGTNTQSGPTAEQVADQFMNALVKGDNQAAHNLLSAAMQGMATPQKLYDNLVGIGSGNIEKWVRQSSVQKGDIVTVDGTAEFSGNDVLVTLELKQFDGTWKIISWAFSYKP
jgi:hypothetical protein